MKITKITTNKERELIIQLITNDEICSAIIPNLDRKLLMTSYAREVAKWIKEYFDEYQKAPKKDIKKIYLRKKPLIKDDDETKDEISTFLSSISEQYEQNEILKIENVPFAIDEFNNYLSLRNIDNFQEQLKDARESGKNPLSIIEAFKPYTNQSTLPKMDRADNLLKEELPQLKYLVRNLFGWGLIMFCGTHKIGKSFMMLQLAVSVSTGSLFMGKYKCKQRDVLYLCLEDGKERLQKRINDMNFSDKDLSHLHLVYTSRKGKEGLADLSERLKQVPNAKLFIIDALATFRGVAHSKNIFQSDYDAIREIKKWADDNKVCVLLVHHTRKPGVNSQAPVDIVDSVNGSNGLAAAADQTFIMTRPRKSEDGKLYMTSRDIEEKDLAIHFNIHEGGWFDMGDADKVELSQERQDINNILEDAKKPMTTGAIAKALDKKIATVSITLKKMVLAGSIRKVNYGEYQYIE